jgi:hypothetical protein
MATTSHVSRRSLITAVGAALAGTALAAAPLGIAKASEPDPVFAAIEAYRVACKAHHTAIDASDAAQTAFGFDSKEYKDAYAASVNACWDESNAWWDLVETRPTTIAGLIAYVRHFAEHGEALHCEQSAPETLLVIAEVLETLIGSEGV